MSESTDSLTKKMSTHMIIHVVRNGKLDIRLSICRDSLDGGLGEISRLDNGHVIPVRYNY